MLFTVIIPVYNTKDYLKAAVDSVVGQTRPDCEIILVNDGSTDGSGELCDTLAAAHPETIRVVHKHNGGAGDARNAAIPLSRGEYLVFLDSDDTLEINMFARLAEEIEKTHSDVYYFGRYRIENGTRWTMALEPYPVDTVLSVQDMPSLLGVCSSAGLAVWRRRLFDSSDVRFPQKGWCEDLILTRKALIAANSVVFLPDRFYNYLERSGSVTNREDMDSYGEIVTAMEELLDWFRNKGLFARCRDELCELSVRFVHYYASWRILRRAWSHPLLGRFRSFTLRNFPDYHRNRYIKQYSLSRRIALRLLDWRMYWVLHAQHVIATRHGR